MGHEERLEEASLVLLGVTLHQQTNKKNLLPELIYLQLNLTLIKIDVVFV